jgi:hypothetical protein
MPLKRGERLTGTARREKAEQAYALAIMRQSYTEIAKELDVSRNLVSTLVKEEQERALEDRDGFRKEPSRRREYASGSGPGRMRNQTHREQRRTIYRSSPPEPLAVELEGPEQANIELFLYAANSVRAALASGPLPDPPEILTVIGGLPTAEARRLAFDKVYGGASKPFVTYDVERFFETGEIFPDPRLTSPKPPRPAVDPHPNLSAKTRPLPEATYTAT